jgi:hypothetical protein
MRKVRTWLPGDQAVRDLWVGIERTPSEFESWPLELIRVNAITADGSVSNEAFEATIYLTDFGGVLGPIDLPFTIIIPGATEILVRPLAKVTQQIDVVSRVVPIEDRSDRNFATRSVYYAIGAIVPIPQWVRGVGVYDPGRFIFLDRAGAPLTIALDGAHDRPSLATSVQMTVAGMLIFYY